jgi:prephenate dehydrogenase
MNITVIGLGLMGGSLALSLRRSGFANHIVGCDSNRDEILKEY